MAKYPSGGEMGLCPQAVQNLTPLYYSREINFMPKHGERAQGAAGGEANPGGKGKPRLEIRGTDCSVPTQRYKGWGSTGQQVLRPLLLGRFGVYQEKN